MANIRIPVTLEVDEEVLRKIVEGLLPAHPEPAPVPDPPPPPAPEPEPVPTLPKIERHTGINVRGLAWAPSDHYQYASDKDIHATLAEAQGTGFKTLRFYAPRAEASVYEAIDRGRHLLDVLHSYGMRASIVLTDFQDSYHYVRGDHKYRTDVGYTMQWYREGWKMHYADFVRKYVKQLSGHPALWSWEVGNELQMNPPQAPDTAEAKDLFEFFRDATALIREHDPNHLVSSGCQTAWHVFGDHQIREYWHKFYDLFDWISVHSHFKIHEGGWSRGMMGENHDWVVQELIWAKSVNKPVIMGEQAVRRNNGQDAVPLQSRSMDLFFQSGGTAVWQWGYNVPEMDIDNGLGDGYGMQPRPVNTHRLPTHDYLALKSLWLQWSNKLA